MIEYGKKPGLMSYYATSISLVGVGPAFMVMTYILLLIAGAFLKRFGSIQNV
jgi:hypothetical protein